MMTRRAQIRPIIRLVTAAALVAAALTAAAPAAIAAAASARSSSQVGWVRVAHLSPNAPGVDIYLYSVGDMQAKTVLRDVRYGMVGSYMAIPAGEYTVGLRKAGAAATSKEILSTTIDVQAGHAYTVAGMGLAKALRIRVLDDVLSTTPGRAAVRVIQASNKDPLATITAGSQVLAKNLPFASVTSYQSLAPGTVTLHVTGGSMQATKTVALSADTSHTIVILDDPHSLAIDVLMDAAGADLMPKGGAATGFGGMAPRPARSPLPWAAAILIGLLAAAGGGLRLIRTRSRG